MLGFVELLVKDEGVIDVWYVVWVMGKEMFVLILYEILVWMLY